MCPANFDFGNDLAHMYSLPHSSLADRMQKILQSECSETKIKEGKTKLYKNLQKHKIINELHQCGISFWSQDNKANLEDKLINEMPWNAEVSFINASRPNYNLNGRALRNIRVRAIA